MLKLYSYFRSSASYRARIGLHWKKLEFEYIPVHLIKEGGQQNTPEYRRINPMGHVPALVHDDFIVAESLAILQYLEDVFPQQPLFPRRGRDKARVLQICELVNSGIQPLQNHKISMWLQREAHLDESMTKKFSQHWNRTGLANLEKLLEQTSGTYCFGDEFSVADCFVIPQGFSAQRLGVDLGEYPRLTRILEKANTLEAVIQAHPKNQPDTET